MTSPVESTFWSRLSPLVARWAAVPPPELASADHLDSLDGELLAYLDANREQVAKSLTPGPSPRSWRGERDDSVGAEGSPLPLSTNVERGSGGEAVDLAGALALAELRWLQEHNQFLDLGATSQEALRAVGRRALEGIRGALGQPGTAADLARALAPVSAAHRTALGRLVGALVAALPGADQGAPGGEGGVRCAEYSPELQLSLLGLDAASLRGPVLDLGCGAEARLVHHLRAAGVEAFGVDRAAAPGPFVTALDWFAAPVAGPWGTVVSHLGLSHHFMFHHLRGGPQAARYARLYMEVLQSLQPGGAFVYAPGLPFLEPLLPAATYRVSRRPVTGVEAVGGVAPYAARVERV